MRKEISRQEEEKKGNEKEGDQERDSLKRAKRRRRRRGKKGESGRTEIKFNSVKSPLHLPSVAPSSTPPSFPPVEEIREPVGFFSGLAADGEGKGGKISALFNVAALTHSASR